MPPGTIYLWWIGEAVVRNRLLEDVRGHVQRTFGGAADVWRSDERPGGVFDPARGQHSSTRILRWLVGARPPEARKVLAITDVDLFIPVLTFVYGEAQLDGVAAVVSMARLRVNHDGSAARGRFVRVRLVKECLHELGHTFGLVHCSDLRCVMARSISVFDVDVKRATLCPDCRARLRELEQRGGERS